jgi:hypothetical protein
MDNTDKYEHLKFLIERYDNSYDSTNNKGVFYIGLNTFILSGISASYISLYDKIEFGYFICALLSLLLISCFISTILTIVAIKPFTKDNEANDINPSLMFFGGVAKHEASFFKEKFSAQSKDDLLNEMLKQTHCLAKGLNKKFKRLQTASNFITLQFCILIPTIFLIIKNLK